MGVPKAAQAVSSTWMSPVNGSWDDGTKWDTGVPKAGTNALLNVSGSYTVDYTNPVNYLISGIVLINTSGNSTTLNVNTNGFRFTGATLSNATLTVNVGGVVTNTGNMGNILLSTVTSPNSALVINGGRYVQTGNTFGNSSAGLALQMNGGTFDHGVSGGNFYALITMTAGVIRVSSYNTPYSSTISGGVYSNLGAQAFNIRGGTVVVTNQGSLVTTGLALTGNGEVLRVDGGLLKVTGNNFTLGTVSALNSRRGLIVQTAGTVEMAHAAGIVLGANTGTNGTNIGNNQYQLKAGTLSLQKITLGGSSNTGGSSNILDMSGGVLNLGAGGLVTNPPAGSISPYAIQLSGGTVGAQADWSSSLNMTLTNKPGAGTVTFRASDANDVAHDITLSGILIGNGRLTKTGAGSLVLNGLNTYTGTTTVASGTLGGSGSIAGTTTVASNAFVAAAGTNTVGTLTMTNLVMQEGASLAWNYGTATRDLIAVAGKLTLATNAVVKVSAAGGATFSQLPTVSVLATYGSKEGAATLEGWRVAGVTNARVRLDAPNNRLLLVVMKGTLVSVQ
jgi:autotransporter-associated beta strand protein